MKTLQDHPAFNFGAYPFSAGHKGGDTSQDSAQAIEETGKAERLRERVVAMLRRHPGGLTPDECAARMGEDKLSIRPRFSELKSRGIITDTGKRRPSASGKNQRVLKTC